MAEIVHNLLGDARKARGRRFLLQKKGDRKAQAGCASMLNTLLHCWPMYDAGVRDRLKFAIEDLHKIGGDEAGIGLSLRYVNGLKELLG